MSHTAAVSGSDKVYEGAFKQAGVVKANNISELVDFVLILCCLKPGGLRRFGVVTGPGGLGVSIVDGLEEEGFKVPRFSKKKTERRLLNSLPPYAQIPNPIDLTFAVVENEL